MTAAQAAAQLLTTRLPAGAKVLVVGGAGLVTAVRAAGFEVVFSADDEPAAVAQGFAPEVGWAQLAEAAYAIERGAWHVASNLDLSLPTARGFAPGNGSLVGAVRAATGVTPDSAGNRRRRCTGWRSNVRVRARRSSSVIVWTRTWRAPARAATSVCTC